MQIVLGCFLVLLLLSPLYESFDRWDGFPRSGDDTVLNLIAAVTFGGLILVAAKSLPYLLHAVASAFSTVSRLLEVHSSPLVLLPCSSIGESPPALRLTSLRI